MTARTHIDRVLEAFLAEGAETIPDRVIDEALSQIDRTPQRPAIHLPRSVSRMPTSLRLLAVAAVIATAIGLAFTFAGGKSSTDAPEPASGIPVRRSSFVPPDWKLDVERARRQ